MKYTHSRNELLKIAAYNYASAHYRSVVFLREESSELYYTRGCLTGICTAYNVDYEIIKNTDKEITLFKFFHQTSNKFFLEVKIE